jgi:hypothetical protein
MRIKVTEDGALTVKPRDANIAIRQEFAIIGEDWHRKHRPRHFTLDGIRRYGYTPRKRSYNRRKRREYGHTLPLVKSGVSKTLSTDKTVRATLRGVSITMPVRVLNFKTRGSAVNKLAEFRTISDDEIDSYETKMTRNLDRRIRRHRTQQERYQ